MERTDKRGPGLSDIRATITAVLKQEAWPQVQIFIT